MRRRRHLMSLAIAPLLSVLGTRCAAAQMLDVQPGARIRVTAPGVVAGRVDGTVIARTSDSVVVATPSLAQYRFGLGSLKTLEVYQGRSRARGALKGALWTDAIMVPLAILSGPESDDDFNAGQLLALVTIVYGGTGAIIGAIVGAESWKSHDLSPHAASSGGHLNLGVSLHF